MDLRTISGDCIERLKKLGFKWKSSQASKPRVLISEVSALPLTSQSTRSRGVVLS